MVLHVFTYLHFKGTGTGASVVAVAAEHSRAASSDPSAQSSCALHLLLPSMHTPLPQWNDVGGHLIKIVFVILNKI